MDLTALNLELYNNRKAYHEIIEQKFTVAFPNWMEKIKRFKLTQTEITCFETLIRTVWEKEHIIPFAISEFQEGGIWMDWYDGPSTIIQGDVLSSFHKGEEDQFHLPLEIDDFIRYLKLHTSLLH
jgi:hypothetical protein